MENLLSQLNFISAKEYSNFIKNADSLVLQNKDNYIVLYSIEDVIKLNTDYKIDKYLPGFFLIGSDGGGEAFLIEKTTGAIYQAPFIGIGLEKSILKFKSFSELLASF